MAIFEDYQIPAGYKGKLYAGDVMCYFDFDDVDGYGSSALHEMETTVWYEDLNECIQTIEGHNDYDYLKSIYDIEMEDGAIKAMRVVIDEITLYGDEDTNSTGWDFERADEPAYMGEVIWNPYWEN